MKTICVRNVHEKLKLQQRLENAEQQLADILAGNIEKEQIIRREK